MSAKLDSPGLDPKNIAAGQPLDILTGFCINFYERGPLIGRYLFLLEVSCADEAAITIATYHHSYSLHHYGDRDWGLCIVESDRIDGLNAGKFTLRAVLTVVKPLSIDEEELHSKSNAFTVIP
jgi:hypothetical protein